MCGSARSLWAHAVIPIILATRRGALVFVRVLREELQAGSAARHAEVDAEDGAPDIARASRCHASVVYCDLCAA
eukprot:7382844-Prymnesium_polylepis.1